MSQASTISMLATIYHVRVVAKRPYFSLINAISRTHNRMSKDAIALLTFIRCYHEIGPHHVHQQSGQLPNLREQKYTNHRSTCKNSFIFIIFMKSIFASSKCCVHCSKVTFQIPQSTEVVIQINRNVIINFWTLWLFFSS